MSEQKTQPLIVMAEDCIDEMLLDWEKGKEKGSTTHIPLLDQCWKWRKKEFNIWTGYTNEGKSLFLRYLSIVKSLKDDWKFIFCAPEDFPPKEFFDDMIHTVCGASTDRDNVRQVSREAYLQAYELIKNNFLFLYLKPPDNTIREVLINFEEILQTFPASVCMIDPLIKFARPKDMSDRDDLYAAYITSICTDFCRKHDVSLNLVMHQLTPRLTENGYYPKPTLYNIKGGGTWADGTDNILSIWRPLYAKDKMDDSVIFTSQKIKKQKLVGIPQDFSMRFDRKTNRYVHHDTKEELFRFPAFENLHKTLNIGGSNS
jgi:twinkle protein